MWHKLIVNNDKMLKIAKLRQIFATELGKIGLYWLSKDFNNVMPSNLETLADNVEGKQVIPQNLSVLKGHKKAWTEFDKTYIEQNGGNYKPEGWRSLPRGFVGYSTEEQCFYIVGGKWLNEEICNKIISEFGIKQDNYKVMFFPDYDKIIWEEEW
ncbi:MAG: hypothetical protein NC222_06645 [Staphylococcus sp.]|nr:hypothetical protein [Staphylococcus sp.]